jgi:hypothetical protein
MLTNVPTSTQGVIDMSVRRSILAAGMAGAIAFGSLVALPAFAQDTGGSGAGTGLLGPLAELGDRGDRPFLEWRRQQRAERQEAVAAELGVSVDQLRAAARAAHEQVVADMGPLDPSNPPDDAAWDARRDAFRAAVAAELGVSVDQLHDAILAVWEQTWQ